VLEFELFPKHPAKAMSEYESETTQFLRKLMQEHPELEALQRANRATWWDRKLDRDEQKRFLAAEAPKTAYAYFPVPEAPGVPPKQG
jgi:hypothetical protein